SVKKIINPEKPDYSVVSIIIIAVAVLVKLILGTFVKGQGKKVNSGALIASGSDALFDAILSCSVLASAIVFLIFHISLEPYVGILIACFIIKAGLEMLRDTLNDILGKRADAETTRRVKALIRDEEGVRGAYDLIINNYGPNKDIASVHIELPDTMTVEEVDRLTRKLETKVYRETGILLTGVGVYSYNTKNDEAADIRNSIARIVLSHDWVIQMHGFYIDLENKSMRFDAVISFGMPSEEGIETLEKEIKEKYPDYDVYIAPDVDISD
nr:cation diffusion facilitator family transporter [Lachnospiraceae bacterium]